MHDSGKRQQFQTGAVRDTADGKARPDLISPYAQMREGEWMRKGAEKYAERNWEKGIPISRCIASMERHLLAYKMGLTDEDHMAAVRTNASFILHNEEMIRRGILPESLDDMPKYEQQVQPTGGCMGDEPDLHPKQEWSPQDHHLLAVAGGQDGVPVRRKPRVYIAGPMRGLPLFNFPAFDKARDLGQSEGFVPISPADMDRASGFQEDKLATADVSGPEMARVFAGRDTAALLGLRAEEGDAIALLPGWEKSTGAVAEFFLARWLGLRILDARTMQPFKLGALRVAQLQAVVRSIWRTIFGRDL
jgi:hypothetical protein